MELQNKGEPWSIKEELELIKNIQEMLPEKSDNKSYKTTLSKFDWSTISTQTKSPESCRKQFYELKTMILTHKSLNQMLSEISTIVQDPKLRKAQIPSPYNIFQKDYFKVKADELKDSNGKFQLKNSGKLNSAVAKSWKELPDDIRQMYENQYEEQLKLKDLNNIACDKDKYTGIEKSKCSFSHFLQDAFGTDEMPKEVRKNAWESWCQFSFEEKLPHIKMSIEDEARCKTELEEYLINHQYSKTFSVTGPTWEEKEKYLIYAGMPKAPPKRYGLFFLEGCEDFEKYRLGRNKLIVSCKVFKDVPKDAQEKTKKDFHEAWNKYYLEFNEWKDHQSPVIRNLSELYVTRKKLMPYNTKQNCIDINNKENMINLDLLSSSPHDNKQPHTSTQKQNKENLNHYFKTTNKSTIQRVKNTSTAKKKKAVKYNKSPSFGRKITLSFLSDISSVSSNIKQSNMQTPNVGVKRKNTAHISISKKTNVESVSNKEDKDHNKNKLLELQGQHNLPIFPEVIGEPTPVAKTPWLYCLSEQINFLESPVKARQRALKLYKKNESAIKTIHQIKVKEYKENVLNFVLRLPNESKKAYLESRNVKIDNTKYINIFQEFLDSQFDSA